MQADALAVTITCFEQKVRGGKSCCTRSDTVFSSGSTNAEPGAGRGPRAGIPRGVVVTTGSNTQLGLVRLFYAARSFTLKQFLPKRLDFGRKSIDLLAEAK